MNNKDLKGIIAASITPLLDDYSPDYDAIPHYLRFLEEQGCHGALILGTTGEGPSFSYLERLKIFEAASQIRQTNPDFILYAGTGTPSMQETIELNKRAFNFGFDGVVVLPPFYFRKPTENGLFAWYKEVIKKSIPSDGILLGYHIPPITGISLTTSLLKRLQDEFPQRFAGIKDSSGEETQISLFNSSFHNSLMYYVGNDRFLSKTIEIGGSGTITALNNVAGNLSRAIWENFNAHIPYHNIQAKLTHARRIIEDYTPYAPSIKAVLHQLFGFPLWHVRPPLNKLPTGKIDEVCERISPYLNQ